MAPLSGAFSLAGASGTVVVVRPEIRVWPRDLGVRCHVAVLGDFAARRWHAAIHRWVGRVKAGDHLERGARDLIGGDVQFFGELQEQMDGPFAFGFLVQRGAGNTGVHIERPADFVGFGLDPGL